MRELLITLGLFIYTNSSFGQEINVQTDKYPGVKTIITKSPGDDFKSIYELDDKGQIRALKIVKNKRLVTTFEYTFLSNGLLSKQVKTFDKLNPSFDGTRYYSYDFKDDLVYTEICYREKDTLYRLDNIQLNDKGLKIKFLKTQGDAKSINSFTYDNSLLSSWENIETYDSVTSKYLFEYKYDNHGQAIEVKETWSSEAGVETETWTYKFKYNKHGHWTRMYDINNGKAYLAKKRKYSYATAPNTVLK